ncbi:phosphate acyltransferase PlsX [Orbaceae bacterium ac157xtp]
MENLTIALDAMSGDFGPRVVVPAALKAIKHHSNLHLILVGDPAKIGAFLPESYSQISVVESTHLITNEMKPAYAIKHSQGTSMRLALELVKLDKAQACVSAGNTGALMGLSKILLHAIQGIDRPALVSMLPVLNGKHVVVLDLGANVECDSEMLVQFALMGEILAKATLAIEHPRVALLNIGEEEAKGLDCIRLAASSLKASDQINFIGYLEANDLLTGKTDVLVCDGFSGNVMLKTLEGTVRVFLSSVSNLSTSKSIFANCFSGGWQKKMIKNFGHLDPNRYNGACLLGLQSIVIKSHGSADESSFLAAIEHAITAIKHQIPERIATSLSSALSKSENN